MGTWNLETFRRRLVSSLGNPAIDNDELDGYINAAYHELCSAIDFKGTKTTATFTTVLNQTIYDLPTDVRQPLALSDESNNRLLSAIMLADYQRRNTDTDYAGQPEEWTWDVNCLYIWPSPDEAGYSLELLYLATEEELSAAGDVTLLNSAWDMPVLQLAIVQGLTILGKHDAADAVARRAYTTIRSRRKDVELEKRAMVGGVNVAWSLDDLRNQET